MKKLEYQHQNRNSFSLLLKQNTKELHPGSFKTFRFIPINYKKRFIRKEGRKPFATNSKGRYESFHEDPNALKKFCNVQAKTKFCIRKSDSRGKYSGNTPKKRPRKKDFSDKYNFKKKLESKTFVKQLIRQSDR